MFYRLQVMKLHRKSSKLSKLLKKTSALCKSFITLCKFQHISINWKRFPILKKILIVIIWGHIIVFGSTALVIFSYNFVDPPTTSLALYRKYINGFQNQPVEFVLLKDIPRRLQNALISLEDYNFRAHQGVNLRSIWRASKANIKSGKVVYGGSTITQQLARTLFLSPRRSYLRKYCEIILAVEIDILLSKDRILELYFNYAEFGEGIYGMGQASHFYFHEYFYNLDIYQMGEMLIILPNPLKYGFDDIRNNSNFKKRTTDILNMSSDY